MADSKLSVLTDLPSPADGDQLYVRDISEATAAAQSKRMTLQTLRTWLAGFFAASAHSHSNATTGAAGFMSAADKTKLDGIEAGAAADQAASEVTFSPTGNIAASNVQTAIAEVDTEKVAIANFYAGAGAPSGDPGAFTVYFDTTNKMLYVWDTVGSQWLVNEMYVSLPNFLVA